MFKSFLPFDSLCSLFPSSSCTLLLLSLPPSLLSRARLLFPLALTLPALSLFATSSPSLLCSIFSFPLCCFPFPLVSHAIILMLMSNCPHMLVVCGFRSVVCAVLGVVVADIAAVVAQVLRGFFRTCCAALICSCFCCWHCCCC